MIKRETAAPQASVVVSIGGDLFLLNELKAVVEPLEGDERYLPATCSLNGQFARELLQPTNSRLIYDDDTWPSEFLEVLIFPRSKGDYTGLSATVRELPGDLTLPVGPYILHSTTGRVYSVLKLYDDYNNAFVGGVVPDGSFRYKWLQCSNKIPVPPRYSSDQDPKLPLNGLRFGVKDVIDVAGLETGNGSKCHRELYPPRESTSICIQKLIDAGAIMVGKMRCCQWCDGQDPLERLEEVTPTNPRGDTFQKPSASSSGSAAGCASYEWLDFTVGTDTGGSVRHPAGVNGLYGIRPSHGSMESSGLVCTALMDTPGVFARAAHIAEAVTKVMMTESQEHRLTNSTRFKLLYVVEPEVSENETPKFFSRAGQGPETATPAGQIMEKFVQALEENLECKRQETDIFGLWKATHPECTSDDMLKETNDVYKNIVYGQLSRDVVQPFSREYEDRYGRKPFIEANTMARLEHGASVSDAELQTSIRAFDAFAGWVNRVLLPRPSTHGDGIEEIPLQDEVRSGLLEWVLSVLLELLLWLP
ncbi:hypothetical protein TruAng_002827 [Truncatella angustata]|nr:hypothetical protein TruAng_002827 [Truncatella angustata]